jgi:hypothetical protein
MTFRYQINLSDPTGAGASISSVLSSDLAKALDVWSGYIDGQGTLVVNLNFTQTSTGRLAGGPASISPIALGVVEPGAEYELATGSHVPGYSTDINVTVDTGSGYVNTLDLSPDLTYQSPSATNKYNPILLFLHELFHGFGMSGYYSQTGINTTGWKTNFDGLLQLGASGSATLTGTNVTAIYGGNVPITTASNASENYYHFGTTMSDYGKPPSSASDPLTLDLMNGIVFNYNYNYTVSNLDLALLRDLGYNVPNISLVGTSARDQIRVGTGHYTVDGGTGVDTVVIPSSAANYGISQTTSGYCATNASGSDRFDLCNVERVQFSDKKVALASDMGTTQSGGEAALLIGAVLPGLLAFDPSKQTVLGAAIGYFDQGLTMPVLAGALLRLPIWDTLAGGSDNTHIAQYLLTNVNAQVPDQPTLTAAVSALNGEMSQGIHGDSPWLASLALSSANQTHVGLIGLAQSGLAFQ